MWAKAKLYVASTLGGTHVPPAAACTRCRRGPAFGSGRPAADLEGLGRMAPVIRPDHRLVARLKASPKSRRAKAGQSGSRVPIDKGPHRERVTHHCLSRGPLPGLGGQFSSPQRGGPLANLAFAHCVFWKTTRKGRAPLRGMVGFGGRGSLRATSPYVYCRHRYRPAASIVDGRLLRGLRPGLPRGGGPPPCERG